MRRCWFHDGFAFATVDCTTSVLEMYATNLEKTGKDDAGEMVLSSPPLLAVAQTSSGKSPSMEYRARVDHATGMCVARMPLRLTVREFSMLVRLGDEAVRLKIRAGTIEAQGRPHLIPRRELGKFGIGLADAAAAMEQWGKN
jgi:hypothetical protein